MKLEEILKTSGFRNERHKALLSLMFHAYTVKTKVADMLKPFGLTTEQFNVLRILKGSHPTPLCVKDIAGRMIERNSNVPRIADRLVAKGLCERRNSPQDRRETLLYITPSGMQLLQQASTAIEQGEDSLINLNTAELGTLNQLLDNML